MTIELKNVFANVNNRKIVLPWLALILAIIIISIIYIVAYFRDDYKIEADGRLNIGFNVFYMENDIFDENPVPQNLFFLKSFTDFYEIDNSFFANFNKELDIYYTYTATKRLIIRYIQTGDANLNPIVYEEKHTLSETSGYTTAESLNFYNEYSIFPRPHIMTYLNFVAQQEQQMQQEGLVVTSIRGFSAELMVDFTYTLLSPDVGLNETITRGYRIPLSNEIYSFINTGIQNFETVINLSEDAVELTLPVIILLVATFSASVLGLCYTLKRLMADPNEHRREVDAILKKYSNEIVISSHLDLSGYTVLAAIEFDELLKLAVNLNKHIMCCYDEKQAQFATIVEKYAYLYTVEYNPETKEDEKICEEEKVTVG